MCPLLFIRVLLVLFWKGFAFLGFFLNVVPSHGFSPFNSTMSFGVFLCPTVRRRMETKEEVEGVVWWLEVEEERYRQTEDRRNNTEYTEQV